MKSWARELALGLLLATAIPSAAVMAAQSAEQILLDKANYWRLKDRPDLAIEALQQLLSINPSQPDALYQYGIIEVQRGRIDAAKGYLGRLQKAAPSSPRIADLENAIRAGQVSPNELSEARRLAQSGQFSAATKKYQQTFQGPPPPTFGVEYYMTLAGTPQGWDQARRGLETLVQNSPHDSKAKLALAEVLTYHADTRAQGIRMLAVLAGDPVVGAQAGRSWKQALMWLGARPEDRQLYSQYLAKYPQDAELRQHIAEVEKPGAAGPAGPGAIGYNDLNRGNLAAAERQFAKQLRQHPGDADALAGLGLVRLRQQRFGEARNLLGRAMHAAPSRRSRWAAAYATAEMWSEINEGKAAAAAGNYARAEAAYRRALAAHPDNSTALVGLYTALTAEGKTVEAASLSARVAALGPGQLAGANRARADMLRAEGRNLESHGDAAGAQAKYQEAIAVDPNDAWARLDFARFLVRRGDASQGVQIVDPAASGGSAESYQAAAIFYSEQNRQREAVALLDRIPPRARSTAIVALRDRLIVTAEIDRAKELAHGGNQGAARNVLVSLYGQPPRTAEKTRLIAGALADIGDTSEALQLARRSAAAARSDPRATVDYAALLMRAGRDAEAVAYLSQAERSGTITADGRRELEHIKGEIAAKRADRLRERGDLAGAYDQISPLLSAYPNEPTLLLAAGRIYAAAGKNDVAMRFFDAAYRQAPGDLGVIRGAVGGAIVAGDLYRASAYLAAGMQRFPNNPRLYYLAAQIDRAGGDNGAAIYNLEVARRLDTRQAGAFEPASSAAPMAVPGLPGALPPNPFRQSQAEAARPLMRLAASDSPIVATDGSSGSPSAPAALQETAVSADSEDLVVPPHAGERPSRRVRVSPAVASNSVPLATSQPAPLPPAAAADVAPGDPPAQGQPEQLAQFEPLPPPPVQAYAASSYADNYPRQGYAPASGAMPLQPLPPPPIQGYQPPMGAPAPRDSLELDIQHSMQAIAAESGPVMQGGFAFRERSGENGLSALTDVGIPLEASFSPFYTGTVRLQAVPTYLTSGTVSSAALTRFGQEASLALIPGFPASALPSPGSQNASGVSLNAGYAYQMFAGEIGTTPLGFPVENIVGRLALQWPGPAGLNTAYPMIPPPATNASRPLQVRVEGVRQPVTDSLLSYAGTKDPVSGLVWGGVIKTGGNALVSYDDGDFGIYGGAGASFIDGKSVASNSELEGTVGAYVRPYRTETTAFKVGLNLNFMGYDKDLRYFTFGQGGYFSPQSYFNISVPLEYTGRYDRLSWLAGAAIGLQTFHEDKSAYYPYNAGLQSALQGTFGNLAYYPARNVTGPAFFLNGQVEYKLDNGFSIGGLATVDNAQNFTEGVAKVYLRKSFGALPAAAYRPNSLAGSL